MRHWRSSLRAGLNRISGRYGKANPPRVWIFCIVCGREENVPASSVRPPRANVPLCGRRACHVVWKSAIANQFDIAAVAPEILQTSANRRGESL